MKFIPLTKEKFATVDNVDFFKLRKYNWYFSKNGYAIARINGKPTYMHSIINKTKKGLHTDHINRNKLDNRKDNLRSATCSQNLLNSKTYHTNNSGHRGVFWYERYKKWEVYISVNKKRIYLGRFKKLNDAISARKKADKLYI